MIFTFPYKDNTLSGIFGEGIRKGNKAIKYETKLSSVEGNFDSKNCFDGNSSTFCHTNITKDESEHYLQVHFQNVKLMITGFAIQNRGCCWEPTEFIVQGSNNGVNFTSFSTYKRGQNDCSKQSIKTYKIEAQREKFSYIRYLSNGLSCTNVGYKTFNIAEFDLFGKLYSQALNTTCTSMIYTFLQCCFILVMIIAT